MTNPTKVSIGAASAQNSVALTPGDYYVEADIDCYVKQGTSAAAVATSSTRRLRPDYELVVRVTKTGIDDYIGVLTKNSGETGTLWISPVESV
jgi:hypothetical protein